MWLALQFFCQNPLQFFSVGIHSRTGLVLKGQTWNLFTSVTAAWVIHKSNLQDLPVCLALAGLARYTGVCLASPANCLPSRQGPCDRAIGSWCSSFVKIWSASHMFSIVSHSTNAGSLHNVPHCKGDKLMIKMVYNTIPFGFIIGEI